MFVWSNPHASDTVMIRNAIMIQPSIIPRLAEHFGIERILAEWKAIQEGVLPYPEEQSLLARATPLINRQLHQLGLAA